MVNLAKISLPVCAAIVQMKTARIQLDQSRYDSIRYLFDLTLV